MTEDHPFNNKNFYGATKICAEAMAHALHHRYGLNYVGLRYMNVYGPRSDYKGAYIAVIMKMLDSIVQGLPLKVYGDGSQAYDFITAEDCGHANVTAMKAETTDRYYNVGTGIRTSILELAKCLIDVTGSSSEIVFEPAGLTFVMNRIGSPDRAREEIGFVARTSLDEGLRQLAAWHRTRTAEG